MINPQSTRICAVIPTHNRPELLPVAVRSVLGQDVHPHVDIRVVVVDDASEPTARKALGALASNVHILRNDKPRGPAAARNQGASAVEADLIAFLDDDDHWLPGKLSACLEAYSAYPDAAMVFHQVAFDWANVRGTLGTQVVRDAHARMLHRQPPHLDGVIVTSKVHQAVQFDESFQASEDLDYLLRVAMAGPLVELGAVLAVHGDQNARQSAMSIQSRIEGRKQLRSKHAALFDRSAKAYSDFRLGQQYRRLGRRGTAAASYMQAVVNRPLWLAPWKGIAALPFAVSRVEQMARWRRQR